MNKDKFIKKLERGVYPNLDTIEVPELSDTDMLMIYNIINNNALEIDKQINELTNKRRKIGLYYHKIYMKR